MIHTRRTTALAVIQFTLTMLPLAAWSQALPRDASKAGFIATAGKRMASFEVKSLTGSSLSSKDLAGSPALFHIWSARDDPAGNGPALAASLREALLESRPDAAVIVLSADTDDAKAAIRALGSPSAPAWIFVSPVGEIVAYRLGRLSASQAGTAVEALFGLYPSDSRSVAPIAPAAPAAPAPGTAAQAKVDASAPGTAAQAKVDASASIEERILAELNLARTKPSAYIEVLKEYRTHIRGNYLERPGETTVVLNEGVRAVDEAIAFLSRQTALPPLTPSAGLRRAAADHAADQGRTGQTGHAGSDRSTMKSRVERYGTWSRTIGENIAYGAETARDVVIQLIVDDGVASRGHRANIFNPGFLVVGIAFGAHPTYRTVCVQDFAGGYTER
ncbi:MAG TPA: CAP domain-containing protein [Spirochaetales bacterium]|nr:CAP domain-containing protein [Spirochaetales bacterium]